MSPHAEPADTVIEARWVIPLEPARDVLADHSVVITGDRITAILPTPQARASYRPRQRFELAGHALIPGLINLHTHAAMTLMRGLADDLPLMDWLNQHVWPAEMRHVSDSFVYDGTRLACAEMLRGGVTTFNDMYFFPQAAARAALRSRHARGTWIDRRRVSVALRVRRPGLPEQRTCGARRTAQRTAAELLSRAARALYRERQEPAPDRNVCERTRPAGAYARARNGCRNRTKHQRPRYASVATVGRPRPAGARPDRRPRDSS